MDEAKWEQVARLFEKLITNPKPEQVLAEEPDQEVRIEAERMWRSHNRAEDEEFLERPIDFQTAPVFETGERLLDGRFRIVRMLGAGGMGEVYLAFDERLREQIAIKTIPRMLAASPQLRRRIVAEVQNARRVPHENVCRIYELFDQGDTVFFTMEFIDGRLLSEILDRQVSKSVASEVVRQMAAGLHSAHRTGVIHGDFKPSNVMVVDGQPLRAVVMDFGLALAIAGNPASAAGSSLRGGAEEYMAPELLAGGAPTIRSDIYAFGKVAEALLPGRRLWARCHQPHAEERLGSLEEVIKKFETSWSRRLWLSSFVVTAGGAAYLARGLMEKPLRLPEGARVLINRFRCNSGPQAASLVRGLIASALAQSPKVRVLADEDLRPFLQRAAAQASVGLSGQLLTDVLEQLRAAFYIEGDLLHTGSRYGLTLKVFQANGRFLVQRVFNDFPTAIELAAQAAGWIRRASGESTASIKSGVEDASTFLSKSPEALSQYYHAMERWATSDADQAIPMLRQAIALDPDFAQAHSVLASCLGGAGQFDLAFLEASKALKLRPRLPVREQVTIEATCFPYMGDTEGAVTASRQMLGYFPNETRYLRLLARNLVRNGDPAAAIKYNQQAIELAPDDGYLRNELVVNLVAKGDFTDALAAFEERGELARQTPYMHRGEGLALMGLGRYEEAAMAFDRAPKEDPTWEASARILAGDVAVSLESLLQAEVNPGTTGPALQRFEIAEFLCGCYYLTAQPAIARQYAAKMIGITPVPYAARWINSAAFWAARTGETAVLQLATRFLSEIESRSRTTLTTGLREHAEGLNSLHSGQIDKAIESFRRSTAAPNSVWPFFNLAELHAANGHWDLARRNWQEVEQRTAIILNTWFPGTLVISWLGRAQAEQALGDRSAARTYATKILDRWSSKNHSLPIVALARKIANA